MPRAWGRRVVSRRGRKRRRSSKRFAVGIAALLCTSALLAFASRIPSLLIRTVHIVGARTVLADDLRAIADDELRGEYGGLFLKRSIVLYPERRIRARILGEIPRVSNVRLDRDGLDAIRIEVTERTPQGLWCGGEDAFESASAFDCYFLDESGYVYAESGTFSGGVFHTFYGDLGSQSPIGTQFMSAERFASYKTFRSQLKSMGYDGDRSLVRPNKSIVLVVRSGERFLLSGSQPFESALSYLDAVIRSGEIRGKDVSYFDLRFGKRVYYKLRDE